MADVKKRPGSSVAAPQVKRRPGAPTGLPTPPHTPTPRQYGPPTGETGLLSDPEQDRRAWMEAKAQDAIAQQQFGNGPIGETFSELGEGLTMNIDRPIAGLVEGVGGLINGEGFGEAYDRGKAVDAYADSFREARTGIPGKVAEFAGGVFTPSPGGKAKWLIEALQGGAQSAIEGENLSTEGQNRDMTDRALDVAIGTGVTGALSGVGRAIKPGELIDAPKLQGELNTSLDTSMKNLGVPRVEDAGTALREALLKEQGALKSGGKKAMRKAVAGDFSVQNTAGDSVSKTVDNIYNSREAPIPITPEGTPATAAFRDQINMETAKGDSLTLEQIDALRIKARGLRSAAANPTDKKALADLDKALSEAVTTKTNAGDFTGDKAYKEAYDSGKASYEKAMKIADIPKLKAILKDDSTPGAAIADAMLSINTSSKSKSPAKLASVIVETLGEGSESLSSVRSGVLATMFEGANTSPEAQARLLKTLERNENLINDLFTPDQVSELAGIRVDLSNAAGAKDSIAARAKAEKRLTAFLSSMANSVGKVTAHPGKAGVVTSVASGSGAAGLTVTGVLSALKIASSRPVRSAASAAMTTTAKPLGREASQNKSIDKAARDTLINQLGAR